MSNAGPSPIVLPVSPSFDELRAIERADLNQRRTRLGRPALSADADSTRERVAGLALSGGGVRSAALSLGAIEALSTVMLPDGCNTSSAPAIFNQIDYVSSVSGGSYAACSISAKIFRDNATLALSPESDPHASSYLSFVRTHSKLLDDYFEILTNWMYGFLVGVLTVLPFLLVVAAVEIALLRDDKELADAMSFFSDRWRYALISGGLVYLLFAVISSSQITDRKAVERLWKFLLLLLVFAWFVGLQPLLIHSNLPGGRFHEFLQSMPLSDAVLRTEAQEVLIPGAVLLLLAAILISLLLRREQFLRDKDFNVTRVALRRRRPTMPRRDFCQCSPIYLVDGSDTVALGCRLSKLLRESGQSLCAGMDRVLGRQTERMARATVSLS
jgi:patatin-like phospholipase